jgi:adenosylhomocysteine nucleosidase
MGPTTNLAVKQRLTAVVLPLIVVGLFLVGGCAVPEEQADQAVRPYLILYAFDTEGELLAESMTVAKTEQHLGRKVYQGTLSGKPIVLAESGVGMTNAAMTTQHLIDSYQPQAVVFSGIAGAIDSSVRIGDIVVCDSWITHDYGYYGSTGFTPRTIEFATLNTDTLIQALDFCADSALFSAAAGVAQAELSLQTVGDRTPKLIIGGVGVSGNSFIDSFEKRVWLSEEFGALVTDMESAAVAQVGTVNTVPFIVFRSASDLAGGSGSDSAREEIGQFFEVAAINSSQVVMEFLKAL